MVRLERIALVFDQGLGFDRDILRGIRNYMGAHAHWSLIAVACEPKALRAKRCRECDGLIGHLCNESLARAALRLPMPVVTVSGVLSEYPIPRVSVDHQAVGRMAADHLLERGHRHFGFVGNREFEFSVKREEGFRSRIEQVGFAVQSYYDEHPPGVPPAVRLFRAEGRLIRWLRERPRPSAVFAANSVLGFRTSAASHEAGVEIPKDVALLDVDNDDLLCNLCWPPLSSVAIPTSHMGFEGARLLEQLMSGRKPRSTNIVLPPLGIVVRRSFDALATDDPDVAAAGNYIRENCSRRFDTGTLVRHLNISRRKLENKFRQLLGRGVAQEIRRAHLERAKTLLTTTDLPVATIAELSGFSTNAHLSVAFRRDEGITPSEYRQRFR